MKHSLLLLAHAKDHLRRKKRRATELNVPFSLTVEDLYSLYSEAHGALCPVLNIPMVLRYGQGGSDDTPSLDRVIPEKGYVSGNVAIISQRANRIKHEASVEELRALVAYIDRHIAEFERDAALAAQELLDADYEPVDPEPLDLEEENL